MPPETPRAVSNTPANHQVAQPAPTSAIAAADAPAVQPQPVAAAAPASTPAPLPDYTGFPVDFALEVYCPNNLLAALAQLLPYGADVLGILGAYFDIAKLRGTVEGTRSRVTFPMGYIEDGKRHEALVTIKRKNEHGLSWAVRCHRTGLNRKRGRTHRLPRFSYGQSGWIDPVPIRLMDRPRPHPTCPSVLLVAGELAMDAVRPCGILTQTRHAVLLVGGKLPSNQYHAPGLSSVPSQARMCVATRSRNIRSWLITTEQPGNSKSAASSEESVSTSRSLVGSSKSSRLPPCLSVSARFKRLRSPARKHTARFCWSWPLKPKLAT